MSPTDFTQLESSLKRAIANETCAPVMPGQLAELLRLARIGREVEAAGGKPT